MALGMGRQAGLVKDVFALQPTVSPLIRLSLVRKKEGVSANVKHGPANYDASNPALQCGVWLKVNASAPKHVGENWAHNPSHYVYTAVCSATALNYHALFFSYSGNGLNGPQNVFQKAGNLW